MLVGNIFHLLHILVVENLMIKRKHEHFIIFIRNKISLTQNHPPTPSILLLAWWNLAFFFSDQFAYLMFRPEKSIAPVTLVSPSLKPIYWQNCPESCPPVSPSLSLAAKEFWLNSPELQLEIYWSPHLAQLGTIFVLLSWSSTWIFSEHPVTRMSYQPPHHDNAIESGWSSRFNS